MAADSALSFRRAADALLRGSAAASVKLRIPAPAIAGDATEQLGLATPQFQDVEVAPAAFRNAAPKSVEGKADRRDLIVSATAIEHLTGSHAFASADALFASAFGILVDDTLLAIVEAAELEAGGLVYAYQLTLREPLPIAP